MLIVGQQRIAQQEDVTQPARVYRGLMPLLQQGNILWCQRTGTIGKLDLESGKFTSVFALPGRAALRIARVNRFAKRVLRAQALWACPIEAGRFLVATRDAIYAFDEASGSVVADYRFVDRRYFLDVSRVRDIRGFPDGIYTGDYFANPDKLPARLLRRRAAGDWEVCHTFGHGEINHVHAVIPDRTRACLWVLTGDFGSGPAIWEARENFAVFRRVFTDEQRFRACWLRARADRLVWGTDTQLEPNHVLTAVEPWDSRTVSAVGTIPGSSIYWMEHGDDLYFSTVVEPPRASRRNLSAWFARRPAETLSNNASVFRLDRNLQITEVVRSATDGLPLRLFQYATFRFPKVTAPGDFICMYGRSVQSYDDVLLAFANPAGATAPAD